MNSEKKPTEVKESSEQAVDAKESRSRPKRAPRRSLSDDGRLKFPSIPGFHTYLIATDKELHANRMQNFKDNYWEPVLRKELYGEDCDNPEEIVGTNDSAQLRMMKLPLDLKEEDDKARQLENDSVVKKTKEDAVASFGLLEQSVSTGSGK